LTYPKKKTKKMTIKEKILSYLDATGRVKSDFYKAIGATPSNFKGAAKNSALSSDKIATILELYPDLSPDWLLNDVGEMIRGTAPTAGVKQPLSIEDKLLTIIAEKDAVIQQQAEELGQLREQVVQLRRRLEKTVTDADMQATANVG
jgi:hypothetical protein